MGQTNTLQHLHLLRHNPNLLVILTLKLIVHRIRISALLIRRRRPEATVSTPPPTAYIEAIMSGVCAKASIHRWLRTQVARLRRRKRIG